MFWGQHINQIAKTPQAVGQKDKGHSRQGAYKKEWSGEWKALENTWSNVRDEECKIIKDPFTLAAPFSLLFELF